MEIDKLYSTAAEAAVIASMILDKDCVGKVMQTLPSEDAFYLPENRLIYEVLLRLYADGKPIDPVLLRDSLETDGKLEEVGGTDYLREVLESVPSSANALYYAKVVQDRKRLRDIVSAVDELKQIPDEYVSLDEMVGKIQEIALGLETKQGDGSFIHVADSITQVATDLCGQETKLLKTGYRNIDSLIQGIGAGDLCIIAGRPSMGKSSLALGMALNMAEAGIGVLIISLEMTTEAIQERAVCSLAKQSMADAKANRLNQEQWNSIYQASLDLSEKNLIISTKATTPNRQIALIRQLKKKHNIGAVFIDYLQLMSIGGRVENRQQEISTISRKLKTAAITEDIPIIALSQLNREVESRLNHRPRMSDLRESGAIEQDADQVLLLHREDYYRLNKDVDADKDGIAEVIVAKNRNGPPGIARMVFIDESFTFGDLSYIDAE